MIYFVNRSIFVHCCYCDRELIYILYGVVLAAESEIVNAIEWLCDERSSYIVGHTLAVDGGLSLR